MAMAVASGDGDRERRSDAKIIVKELIRKSERESKWIRLYLLYDIIMLNQERGVALCWT